MQAIKKVFIILIIIAVTILFTGWDYFLAPREFVLNETFVKNSDTFFTYEITKYPSNVEIIPSEYDKQNIKIGIVTDIWNLNFGIIPVNGYGKRYLTISNSEKSDVRVNLKAYGTIQTLISFDKNDFILSPDESAYIDVLLNTTGKTMIRNYTGEIDVIIKKSNFNVLNRFL